MNIFMPSVVLFTIVNLRWKLWVTEILKLLSKCQVELNSGCKNSKHILLLSFMTIMEPCQKLWFIKKGFSSLPNDLMEYS
ncbi:CLUMA_CG020772, isoform A [Clunio marinus]|uniref:CLUMA_CG020772, isoform A n=1 Tax=Clunio marinus TaxID=568069 RepID=A0A1J1J758_9DIPT|nr:CLUMA_CG020772, isoform A [Clunio marinus]